MVITLIGIVVGLVLGLTGAGGSIFSVPLLMMFLGWPITEASTVSLLAVSVSAGVGAAMAFRSSYIRYRTAALIFLVGAFFAPLGIQVADWANVTVLRILFAAVLAVVSIRMYQQAIASAADSTVVRSSVSGDGAPSVGHAGAIGPTGRIVWTVPVFLVTSGIGVVAGFLSGLLGVGGGFIIVPLLRSALPLSMHSAVATSLLAIALTSASTTVSGVLLGRTLPLAIALPFVAAAVGGMVIGRLLAPKIAGPTLQKVFACTGIVVAFNMVLQTIM